METNVKHPSRLTEASAAGFDPFILALIAAGETESALLGVDTERAIRAKCESIALEEDATSTLAKVREAVLDVPEPWPSVLSGMYPKSLRDAVRYALGDDPTILSGPVDEQATITMEDFITELARERSSFTAPDDDDDELNRVISEDDVAMFKALAEEGALSASMRVFDGGTILHVSVRSGAFKIVDFMIETGFPLHLQDGFGDTALHDAAAKASPCFEKLWKAGASNRIRNLRRCRPTDMVLLSDDVAFADHVVEMGFATIEDMMTGPGIIHAILEDRTVIPVHFCEKRPDLWKRKGGPVVLASHAVRLGHPAMAIALLKAGVIDKDAVVGKMTLLQYAVHHRSRALVDALIEAGADVNLVPPKGRSTMLFAIAGKKDEDLVRILLAHGAELTSDRDLLLQKASAYGYIDVLKALAGAGADFDAPLGRRHTALLNAVLGEDAEGFFWLLGVSDIEKQNRMKVPLLVNAVNERRIDFVDQLLEVGASVHVARGRLLCIPPLSAAVASENLDLVVRLVERGADVNRRGALGISPGVQARLRPTAEAKRIHAYLVEHGARDRMFSKPVRILLFLIAWAVLSWLVYVIRFGN